MNKLILMLALANLMACTTKQVIVVTHKKQYKLYKEIAQVKKLDSIPKDYYGPTEMRGYTIGQKTDDSCITRVNYPQLFGLVNNKVQDSINQRLQKGFLKSIDQSKVLSDSLKKFGVYYNLVDYIIYKQSRKQLILTQITLDGLLAARNFQAINWVINLRTGNISTQPIPKLIEVFKEEGLKELYTKILKYFDFKPYLEAHQKGELLLHTHNLHLLITQKHYIFLFTGGGLVGFRSVKIPKSELKHLQHPNKRF